MDLNLLKEKLEMEELHLAREALVITISEISRKDITPRPILVLPICDHKNESLILEIIPEIIKQFNVHNKDASLVNLASDGDSNRRKALNKLRKNTAYKSGFVGSFITIYLSKTQNKLYD